MMQSDNSISSDHVYCLGFFYREELRFERTYDNQEEVVDAFRNEVYNLRNINIRHPIILTRVSLKIDWRLENVLLVSPLMQKVFEEISLN